MTQHVAGKKVQSSASLEWTHDISKIASFGLVKFFFFLLLETSYMEYLEAKQVILIFFLLKKAFMMGTQ